MLDKLPTLAEFDDHIAGSKIDLEHNGFVYTNNQEIDDWIERYRNLLKSYWFVFDSTLSECEIFPDKE